MKKNSLLFSIVSLLVLTGCPLNSNNSGASNISNNSSTMSLVYGDETDLLISEYVEGSKRDKAIEVYNFTDKEVDLSKYTINQYRDTKEPTVIVRLEGKLAPKSTYVVSSSTSSATVLDKANKTDENLSFSGKNAIALTNDGKVVDVLGYIGYALDYAKDITLVRKVDRMEPKQKFDEYDWIRYAPDNFNYLGVATNSCTPEELLAGPVLENKYTDNQQYSFVSKENSSFGGGLAVKVSIKNNIDGDTTDLYIEDSMINPSTFMTKTSYYGTVNKKSWLRVRYQSVDTPESYPGNMQEFGLMAKYYTHYLQNKAEVMYLQSVMDDSLLCNYGRFMGYVWAGRDTLVNYESIKHGYSTVSFNNHYGLTSRDIPYESYMYNAMLYAKMNELGLYGEKDPYWDYDKNVSYCESMNCGNYFENGGNIIA